MCSMYNSAIDKFNKTIIKFIRTLLNRNYYTYINVIRIFLNVCLNVCLNVYFIMCQRCLKFTNFTIVIELNFYNSNKE